MKNDIIREVAFEVDQFELMFDLYDKKEYKEVLNLALSWFVFREDYKKCSTIKSFIGDLEKQNISIKRERKVVQTLI